MINIDCSTVKNFLSDREFAEAYSKAEESFFKLQSGSGAGSEWLGWRHMLADPNDAILEKIDSTAAQIRREADIFIVCGIGGSYLGSRAVISSLSPHFTFEPGPEIHYCGHHISGTYLRELLDYLEETDRDGEPRSVYVNVISKSGGTLETAISFRVLRSWLHNRYTEDAKKRVICTTGPGENGLSVQAENYGYRKFEIPEHVGGRFSVLTPAGLLPAAVAGIDVRTLFYEAVSMYEQLEQNPSPVLEYAACKYALYKQEKTVDVITSFEPKLEFLGKWLQQLFGESEGKKRRGMFPVVSVNTTDLHSIGQFLQEGPRNMMETFLKIEKPPAGLTLPECAANYDKLNYLSGKSFHEINTQAFKGTLQAHTKGNIPSVVVSLNELNAQHIGEFIYFFELMISVYCYCLEVNPFDQPGVEAYKEQMYKLLGKKSQ